jgi:hypothetical protein
MRLFEKKPGAGPGLMKLVWWGVFKEDTVKLA